MLIPLGQQCPAPAQGIYNVDGKSMILSGLAAGGAGAAALGWAQGHWGGRVVTLL